jgi:hypothetical protein
MCAASYYPTQISVVDARLALGRVAFGGGVESRLARTASSASNVRPVVERAIESSLTTWR